MSESTSSAVEIEHPGPLHRLVQPVFWWVAWVFVAAFGAVYWRWRAKGWEGIANEKGPVLLLPNHTSTFDPLWAAFFTRRQVRFMASAQLFRYPALAWLIRMYGAFPKAKFVKDNAAMEHMQYHWDQGRVVLIFPEGTRTWDGRNRPVIPGIGRLIRRLDAPVVYCRIKTGHFHQPRWARYPRWVPMRIEYDGPHRYPDMKAALIEDEVNKHIAVEADVELDGWAWGYRMAEGFPLYMWACPNCLELDALAVAGKKGNSVACPHCGAAWRLDANNRMHPHEGTPVEGQPVENILVHRDRMMEALGSPPVQDAARLEAEDIVLEEPGAVGKVTRSAQPETLAKGLLRLTRTELQVVGDDGQVLWTQELRRLQTVSFELGGVVQLRAPKVFIQLEPESASTMKWGHFIVEWSKQAGARRVRYG